MIGITRGISTLIGAAVAGFLIWLAVQIGQGSAAEYWTTYGLVAAAGLTMALSQILGGWTKWGWPRLSLGVFLLGFLPVLLVGGWVLLARQPADFFNTSNWSRDLGIMGVVGDLGELLTAIAFGIGLTFGLTFDTAGPRREVEVDEVHEREVHDRPVPVATTDGTASHVRPAADEPLTAERAEQADVEEEHRRFGRRRRPVAANPEHRDEL
jgi:signal transduction histidine kinase